MSIERENRKEWQEPIMKIADAIDDLVLSAVREEREACAMIAVSIWSDDRFSPERRDAADMIAERIRARSNPQQ